MKRKTFYIFMVFVFLFLILIASLYRWQIIDGPKWAALAESNRKFTKKIQSLRGVIKSRDGKILASNEIVYNIYIYKPNIKGDLSAFTKKVAEILATPPEKYQEFLNNNQVKNFKIGEKVSQVTKDKLVASLKKTDCERQWNTLSAKEKAKYDCNNPDVELGAATGIDIESMSRRVYPNGSIGAHVLGFVGNDKDGNQVGSYGVEGSNDQYLVGRTGYIEGIRDQAGNIILRDDLKTYTGEDGAYLQLTIDLGIQKIVEDKLKSHVEAQKAKGGSVVVMDTTNGEILAFANYPTYDPSKYYDGEVMDCALARYRVFKSCESVWSEKEKSMFPDWASKDPKEKEQAIVQEKNIPGVFNNIGVTDALEPGSIMKIITVAAAINEGKVSAQTKIADHAGCIPILDRTVCNAAKVSIKNQTVLTMVRDSDNIGAYYVAKTLGAEKLHKYLKEFGIGKKVEAGFGDEPEAFPLKEPKEWSELDLATTSFGQNLIVTNSLQNISAIGAIANKGKRVQPHIIKTFVSGDKVVDFKPQIVSTPVTESTASQVVDLMEKATSDGYAKSALKEVLENYTVAGKTGTAQVPDGRGGYLPDAYNNTYVAFAPAKSPRFIMLVTLRQPAGGSLAGTTALPLWADIAKELLPYMGVAPDKKR